LWDRLLELNEQVEQYFSFGGSATANDIEYLQTLLDQAYDPFAGHDDEDYVGGDGSVLT